MRKNLAFSLIEIITVIAIIGVLSTLASVSLKSAALKARDARRVTDINAMRKALEIYKNNNDIYPAEASFILGAPLKVGNDTLIQKLPFNPKVADGPCAINEYLYRQDNGGASYHIFYCLGQKVNNAGPGPCIATPGHHCANCTGGSCANKCGGDDGCGQPCPIATCSYPRPFCEASTGNCICRNNSDCNAGQFCSASGVCVNNGTCAHNNDCGTCMKCSAQGVQGTCVSQAITVYQQSYLYGTITVNDCNSCGQGLNNNPNCQNTSDYTGCVCCPTNCGSIESVVSGEGVSCSNSCSHSTYGGFDDWVSTQSITGVRDRQPSIGPKICIDLGYFHHLNPLYSTYPVASYRGSQTCTCYRNPTLVCP